MKICSSETIIKQACSGSVKKADAETGGKFGEILNETMDKSQMNNAEIRNISTVSGMTPMALERIHSSTPQPPPLVNRMDALLNTLDAYQQKLGDRQYSLRDIHPLVQEIETEKENLLSDFQSLSDNDGIKGILDQTLIAASLEVVKFNRGDYIAQ